ncbi:dnaJ homolog subfamily C member 7 homolog [Argentina anserina]|uniref:dnaJ homolog subfamily C member 7 homolog n=1 Tax=Argentina anserina TaxID=57926 RepID=UPI0021764E88|nr:dnaJ homolog subfamily C member 7 homolog [Potentilla anserina]
MASNYSYPHDPLINLAKMAAAKARDAAEEYFKLRHFDLAIKQAMVAKQFDPDLQGVDHFIQAYQIHKAVSEKKGWYGVLGFQKVTDYATVKKQYKDLARFVHPDKNTCVAAEGAFQHVKAAWDFLADPAKKKAYDKSLSTLSFQGSNVKITRKRACFHAKTSSNEDDRGFFKKTIKIMRTTKPGQPTCCVRISVCRVA